jgi:hypothetical protein
MSSSGRHALEDRRGQLGSPGFEHLGRGNAHVINDPNLILIPIGSRNG